MSLSMRSFKGKNLVALVRKGDYAHPGEEEAIEIVFSNVFPDHKRSVLDVGCGLGGTASFVERKGFGKCTGIDIDQEAINYAKNKYPEVDFFRLDILEAEKLNKKFDLIYLFSVFYSLPDQLQALKVLNRIATFHARLIIFEFCDFSDGKSRLAHTKKPHLTNILAPEKFYTLFEAAGWENVENKDISAKCQKWYANLLAGLQKNRAEIIKKFGEDAFQSAWQRYTGWYDEFKANRLGSMIWYAQKKK
jgi:SAM-dependent methyltransferase